MDQRDLLLFMGFFRGGTMYPSAVPCRAMPAQRSLKRVQHEMLEQERALFGPPLREPDPDDVRRRSVTVSWSGNVLPIGLRIEEVPDPGVLLCMLYDVSIADAPLPIEVLSQTLRRFALRDPKLRAKFDEHVERAGSFVPKWLSPEVRRQRSQEQFDAAMKVAREQGFAHAVPLFEGVRGDLHAAAQVAIAVHELRELGDSGGALRRLDDVVRIAPRNVAARMHRAKLLVRDPSRLVDAATDFLVALREIARPDTKDATHEIRDEASSGLWALHRAFANTKKLEAAIALASQDRERGFEALSRYVNTHPCAWDAQTRLATLALTLRRFDLTIKLLGQLRWLFPDDPNPHFVYGQALAAIGSFEPARRVLEHAASLAPNDTEIAQWLAHARSRAVPTPGGVNAAAVRVAEHVARSLLLLVGLVDRGRVHPVALTLHKLPGDVSLAFVLDAIALQEQRRLTDSSATRPSGPEVVRDLAPRTVLTDYAGVPLDPEQTIGDVDDPGVITAILYPRSNDGVRNPASEVCRSTLLAAVRHDAELAAKLDRHLKSADATLKARLEIEP